MATPSSATVTPAVPTSPSSSRPAAATDGRATHLTALGEFVTGETVPSERLNNRGQGVERATEAPRESTQTDRNGHDDRSRRGGAVAGGRGVGRRSRRGAGDAARGRADARPGAGA